MEASIFHAGALVRILRSTNLFHVDLFHHDGDLSNARRDPLECCLTEALRWKHRFFMRARSFVSFAQRTSSTLTSSTTTATSVSSFVTKSLDFPVRDSASVVSASASPSGLRRWSSKL